ncbi:hypothetical protein FKM82_025489 [Ascaphus truei]
MIIVLLCFTFPVFPYIIFMEVSVQTEIPLLPELTQNALQGPREVKVFSNMGWASPVLKGYQQVRYQGYPCFSTSGSISGSVKD